MLVIVLGIAFGSGNEDQAADTDTNTESATSSTTGQTSVGEDTEDRPTTTSTPAPLSVTAEKLTADKDSNEVAWNKNYLDKQALISGEIKLVEDADGYFDVKLRSDNPFIDIVCKINKSDSSEAVVLDLAAGQNVTVLGRITDDGIIDLVIKDCSISS